MPDYAIGDRVTVTRDCLPDDWAPTGNIVEIAGPTLVVELDNGHRQEVLDSQIDTSVDHNAEFDLSQSFAIADLGMSRGMDIALRIALTCHVDRVAISMEIAEEITEQLHQHGVEADGEWAGQWHRSAETIVRQVLARHGVDTGEVD